MASIETAAPRGATFSDYYDRIVHNIERVIPVSYTHLTLPTILRV